MRFKLSSLPGFGWLAISLLLLTFSGSAAKAKDLKFQANLIWATDSETSPDVKHKPVDGEIKRKLSELPLKWKNYFLVKRENDVAVAKGDSAEVKLSDKCRVKIKDIDGKNIEVSLIGKGEPILKRTQPLSKGEILVLGGNAPDSTGWLVVLKRVE
jgi:hypothetical protein